MGEARSTQQQQQHAPSDTATEVREGEPQRGTLGKREEHVEGRRGNGAEGVRRLVGRKGGVELHA